MEDLHSLWRMPCIQHIYHPHVAEFLNLSAFVTLRLINWTFYECFKISLSMNEPMEACANFGVRQKKNKNTFCTFWPLEFRKAPNNGHAQLSKLSNMHDIFSHNCAAPLIVFTIQFSVHWCSSSLPSLSLLQSFTTTRLSQLSFSYNLSKAFSQWFRIYDFDCGSLCDELLQWPIDLELAPGASLGVSWVVA